MRSWAIVAAALVGATLVAPSGAAHAQAPSAAKPAAASTARAFADRVIEAAQAGDLFENVTTDDLPKVRHRASGLVCLFPDANPASGIQIFPSSVRGADVSCGSFPGGAVLTMYAMKPAKPLTLTQAFALYVTEVRTAHPEAKPPENKELPAVAGTRAEGLTDWLIARFEIMTPQGPAYSRLAVAVVDGWVIEQRLTTRPGQDWKAADRIGEGAMAATLQEMIPGAKGGPSGA
jgi:hypothetical protein